MINHGIMIITDEDGQFMPNASDPFRLLMRNVSKSDESSADLILYISARNQTILPIKSRFSREETDILVRCYRDLYSDQIEIFAEERDLDDFFRDKERDFFIEDVPEKRNGPSQFDLLDFDK